MADPFAGTATNGNRIDITFDPTESPIVTSCESIVNIQVLRVTVNGTIAAPSAVDPAVAHLDATLTPHMWTVDWIVGESSPDYQQNSGTDGHKTATSAPATMVDVPYVANDNFVSKGGKLTTLLIEFVNYTWCKRGNDCGNWYEGLTWTYARNDDDVQAGRLGTSTIHTRNDAPPPPGAFIAAFDKFNQVKNYVPCK
jgi:hypothetical protein